MAVRKDEVQISIKFFTDESQAYAKLIKSNQEFLKDIRRSKQGTKEFEVALNKMVGSAKKIEGIDLKKLLPDQLRSRAKQLARALQNIPESIPERNLLEKQLKEINNELAEMRQRTRGVSAAQTRMAARGQKAFQLLGRGLAFIGVAQLGQQVIDATLEFDKMKAVLENAVGSKSEAQKGFAMVEQFANRMKLDVGEVLQGYIKLINRGFKPTTEELEKMSDLAKSQGKSLDQFIEALLDAQVGEFERLKELGIRAKKDGDQVELSFKGQTVAVKNTEGAIRSAILAFGDLNGVAGTTEKVAKSTANFTATFQRLLRGIGENGGVSSIMRGLGRLFNRFTDIVAGTGAAVKTATQEVTGLQAAFNSEIEVLKKGNFSQKERNKIINDINSKYGDYLGNLISENASIDEITQAQNRANEAFKQRILLIAFQEKIADLTKKAADATILAFEAEKQRTRLANRDFNEREQAILSGPFTGAQETIKEQEQIFEALREGALNEIDVINKEIEDVRPGFEKLAEEMGTTLDAIFSRFQTATNSDSVNAITASEAEKLKKQREKDLEELRLAQLAADEREIEDIRKKYARLIELAQKHNQDTKALETQRDAEIEAKNQEQLTRITEQLLAENEAQRQLEEDRKNREQQIREELRTTTLTDQQLELEELDKHYSRLIELAELYGEDSVSIANKWAEERDALNKKYADIEQRELEKIEKEKRDQAKKTADFRRRMQVQTFQSASSFLQAGIDLLGRDEEAKKRNANKIKNIAKVKIAIDLSQEIQSIWRNAQGGLGGLIPGFAQAFAGIQTGLAIGRAAIQTAKVNQQKFAGGGFTGPGTFKDETGRRVAGWVHQDEWVAPTWQIQKYPGLFQQLEQDRLRGYNTGGFVTTNTTPTSDFSSSLTGGSDFDFNELLSEIRMMRRENASRSNLMKAYVSLDDLNAAQGLLSGVENEAAL